MNTNIDTIRLAVVGVGYFGQVHCDKVFGLPGVELSAVVDINPQRSQDASKAYGAEPLFSHRDLVGKVDAVVVAAPTSVHYNVARDLLSDGLSLLVEKPLATTVKQADHLCELAENQKLRLQVGHLERFNPVFRQALPKIDNPRYIRMDRMGPYSGRGSDVDVVLELMTHDLDLLLQMTSSSVFSVSAYGWPIISSNVDVVSARIKFEDGLVADLMASRVSSSKCRRFSVFNDDSIIEVDLAGHQIWWASRNGKWPKTNRIKVGAGDPLLEQDRSFVHALQNGNQPTVGGRAGRDAVELAARIRDCMITTKIIPSKMRFAL